MNCDTVCPDVSTHGLSKYPSYITTTHLQYMSFFVTAIRSIGKAQCQSLFKWTPVLAELVISQIHKLSKPPAYNPLCWCTLCFCNKSLVPLWGVSKTKIFVNLDFSPRKYDYNRENKNRTQITVYFALWSETLF